MTTGPVEADAAVLAGLRAGKSTRAIAVGLNRAVALVETAAGRLSFGRAGRWGRDVTA